MGIFRSLQLYCLNYPEGLLERNFRREFCSAGCECNWLSFNFCCISVILPRLVRVYRFINSLFKDLYCISMRSKYPCRICGKKSSNSEFINPGSSKNCLCRPCYARKIRSCLQTIGVQTQTEDLHDNVEGSMYFSCCFYSIALQFSDYLTCILYLESLYQQRPNSYQTISGRHIFISTKRNYAVKITLNVITSSRCRNCQGS